MPRIKTAVDVSTKPISTLPYLNEDGSLTQLAINQLANPFNTEDISWKPTNLKDNKCIALAYADKRVYEERLDQVFGIQNWTVEVEAFYGPYRKIKRAKYKKFGDPSSGITSPEEITDAFKIFTIVRISVNGIGFKESTSDSETDDENSIMTAEAQAFKRACSMFGVGKYLYNLPKFECEVSYGKIKNSPSLPEEAIPAIYCEDCTEKIRTTEFKDKNDNVKSWNPLEISKRSQANFKKDLCMSCMRKHHEATVPADTKKRLEPNVENASSTNQE